MRTLNLGILAHVDAGKTSLTERLLHAAGVIDAVGRVDHGNTQTDTLALERERGITIKTAVASFVLGDVAVNLIDTPGHPDFVAEVDRVLSLLDGAILVVSAVEGVQAQTRMLMRALQRLSIPTLIFVNKVDRAGADDGLVLRAIADKLTPAAVAMARVERVGTREARVVRFGRDDAAFVEAAIAAVAEHDDDVLARYVAGDDQLGDDVLDDRIGCWSRRGVLHPVLFGSAITGAGIDVLTSAIAELLPVLDGGTDDPTSGVVFKIVRDPTGERSAIVRMFSGILRVRDRAPTRGERARVTKVAVFEPGGAVARSAVHGGQIAKISGLGRVRIGDSVGDIDHRSERQFAPPPFEAVVDPVDERDRRSMYAALEALAEDDPLMDLRQDRLRGDVSVSLYGEVQREVIGETLLRDFGIAVRFGEAMTVCIERLAGSGEAVEMMFEGRSERTPFLAGVGLRVDPSPPGSGLTFATGVELGRLPLAFINAVREAAADTLRQGMYGWEIPDGAVTMTASRYAPRQSHAHATFDRNMSSTASDFRLLTPLVLMEAVRRAGTIVHEPVHRFYLEAPAPALGALARLLAGIDASVDAPEQTRSSIVLRGSIPVMRLRELRQQLPGLTQGDGFVESAFDSYQPIVGANPRARARLDPDPLDRERYLRRARLSPLSCAPT